MSRLFRIAASLAALMMVAAGPALANHTEPGEDFFPEFVETPTYLHCNGDAKVSNVHTIQGDLVTWSENAPTDSFQDGAGCGTFDTFLAGTTDHNPIYDFPMRGEFTGNIDNITIRLWAIEKSGSRALDEFTVDVHLQINGQDIVARDTEAHAPPIGDPTDPARLYEVTVTGIGMTSPSHHTMTHDVQLTVYAKFIDGSGILSWVYDAAEVDSGLVFNDSAPAEVTIPRNA